MCVGGIARTRFSRQTRDRTASALPRGRDARYVRPVPLRWRERSAEWQPSPVPQRGVAHASYRAENERGDQHGLATERDREIDP